MTAAIIKRCSKEEIESKPEMKNGDKGRSKSLKAASLAAAFAVTAIIFSVSSGAAFADTVSSADGENTYTDTQVQQSNTPQITEANISEGLAFCQEYPVKLSLDGTEIQTSEKDVPPVIITPSGETAGRTLIPARALFEAMGAEVKWIDETQSVEITRNDFKVTLIIGSQTAIVNTEVKMLDVPALIIDHDNDYYGSTMIPVRFVAEALGCDVKWENDTRTVVVLSPENPNNPNNQSSEGTSEQNPSRGDTGNREDNSANGTITENDTIIIEGYEFPVYDMNSLPQPTENAKTKLVAIDGIWVNAPFVLEITTIKKICSTKHNNGNDHH